MRDVPSHRTITVVKVGVPLQTVASGPVASSPSRVAPQRPAAPDGADNAASRARLEHLVRLIERMTGRDIRLVPPTTYLVSAPNRPEPVSVELVRPPGPSTSPDPDTEPLAVDITPVLRHGTTARLRLVQDATAGLVLHPELDVEL